MGGTDNQAKQQHNELILFCLELQEATSTTVMVSLCYVAKVSLDILLIINVNHLNQRESVNIGSNNWTFYCLLHSYKEIFIIAERITNDELYQYFSVLIILYVWE